MKATSGKRRGNRLRRFFKDHLHVLVLLRYCRNLRIRNSRLNHDLRGLAKRLVQLFP